MPCQGGITGHIAQRKRAQQRTIVSSYFRDGVWRPIHYPYILPVKSNAIWKAAGRKSVHGIRAIPAQQSELVDVGQCGLPQSGSVGAGATLDPVLVVD